MTEIPKGKFGKDSKFSPLIRYTGPTEHIVILKGESVEIDRPVGRGDPPLEPTQSCADIGGYSNVRVWSCDGQTQWYKPLQLEGPWACGTAVPWKAYVMCDGNIYTITS